MSFPLRNPTALPTASELDSAVESVGRPAWVIAELINQYRIACGNQPAEVVRLTRNLPDGEIDRIEILVRKKDLRLAQNLLKVLIPLVGKLGAESIPGLELDERERAALSNLLRTYQDGSHPSCKVGK